MSDDQVERMAAAMWKAEAVDSGAPQSVARGRTPQAFADQAEETRARWHKLARAGFAAMQPQARAEALLEAATKAEGWFGTPGADDIARILHGEIIELIERDQLATLKALIAEEG